MKPGMRADVLTIMLCQHPTSTTSRDIIFNVKIAKKAIFMLLLLGYWSGTTNLNKDYVSADMSLHLNMALFSTYVPISA